LGRVPPAAGVGHVHERPRLPHPFRPRSSWSVLEGRLLDGRLREPVEDPVVGPREVREVLVEEREPPEARARARDTVGHGHARARGGGGRGGLRHAPRHQARGPVPVLVARHAGWVGNRLSERFRALTATRSRIRMRLTQRRKDIYHE